jgi:hypothetical protein
MNNKIDAEEYNLIPRFAHLLDFSDRLSTGGRKLFALLGKISSQILLRLSEVTGHRAGGFGSCSHCGNGVRVGVVSTVKGFIRRPLTDTSRIHHNKLSCLCVLQKCSSARKALVMKSGAFAKRDLADQMAIQPAKLSANERARTTDRSQKSVLGSIVSPS